MHYQSENGKVYPVHREQLINDQTGPLNLVGSAGFDPALIRKELPGLWRYLPFLPIEEPYLKTLGEGMTPLLEMDLDGYPVQVKLEHLAPSGSYKDRGSAVLLAWCRQLGVPEVVQDSSGNAGASVAAYAALHNIQCTILVPESTASAKLKQMEAYGAKVLRIPGTREDTARAALQYASHTYYASHCYHPLFFEGTKTFAFEIAEQNHWDIPDTLILPAGNGTLLIGAYLGFKILFEQGITSFIPRMVAVQTAMCAPLQAAWRSLPFVLQEGVSLAEGIAIAEPVRLRQMLNIVQETGGMVLAVDEESIADSRTYIASKGHYIEPTSAAVIAGARNYLKQQLTPGEKVLTLFSGHGLKSK